MQGTLQRTAAQVFSRVGRGLNTLSLSMNSPFPTCSDEDLAYLRRLIYDFPVVKSIGRREDGELLCATLPGRLPTTVSVAEPDHVDDNGIQWYVNEELSISNRSNALILSTARASVILDLSLFMVPDSPGHLTSLLFVSKKSGEIFYIDNPRLPFDKAVLEPALAQSASRLRIDNWFLAKACDPASVICIIHAAPGELLLREGEPFLVVFALLGATIGGGLFVAYDARSRRLEVRLRRAIRKDQLFVCYQPQVNFVNGTVIGCEALLRWNDRGVAQSPPDFVAAAEENGFITELTHLVVRHVMDDIADVLHERESFTVSINFAAADLARETFLDDLHDMLRPHGIAPRSITIELTERTAGDNPALTRSLRRAREAGHKVAIDDFGIGYSNLGYLRDHPVDYLKIDKSFTETIGTRSVRSAIITQIIDLAKVLELEVIVEGLETEQQIAYVVRYGAEYGQGWVFAEAMPAADLKTWLATSDWGKGSSRERPTQDAFILTDS
ncbi:EAL domain-containing protein [Acuticoccus sp. M5D2P5]|uniref:EAL domain-containing protein n=1 Tax=Acuticoccus kalidii TaxID=2910977 RepID=UPI001F1C7C7E|nr:EAL domain-containing protein [Acuticoccus kalidii]MCF3936754.1 EAL domain-containing protein [Acuticoccus kalidii]